MPSYKPVNAVIRGLDVLMAVNRLRDRASVGEVHRQTGLDKATIVRMLETLIHAGFVFHDRPRQVYGVTGKALLLCAGYDRHRNFGHVVAPIMADFRKRIGWPSDVAIFDRDAMLVVETSREAGPMLVNRHPGYRAPLLAASLGLAYVAHCDEPTRQAILEFQAPLPGAWNDLARDRELARRTFARIRARGYATMHPEYSRLEYDNRISTVGVPILVGTRVLASINVLYLKSALTGEQAVAELLPGLKETAGRIARDLHAR